MAQTLALLGGEAVGAPAAPPHPRFTPDAICRVTALLEAGDTVGLGRTHPVLAEAEAALGAYHGGRQAFATSSGQAALQAILMAMEIGPGDEVICPPYTWGATISPVLAVGAVPIFADVVPETGNLDPETVEAAITPRTKAILVVHLYGQPADMPRFQEIARRHRLKLIEDGSQAHGARIHGTVIGNFSDAAGFSCMGWKLLGIGEAGYLVTDDDDLFWRACMTSQHYGRAGEDAFPEPYKPYVDSLVFTYRISPVLAALFPSQVAKLDGEIAGRRHNAALFRDAMADVWIARAPDYAPGFEPSYHILCLNLSDDSGITRDTFCKAMNAEGVPIGPYVPTPIYTWRRLRWQDYDGPSVYWQRLLEAAGADYRAVHLPGVEWKIRRDLLIGWNYTEPDSDGMALLARAFRKVQDNLPALRAWENASDRTDDELAAIRAARRAIETHPIPKKSSWRP